MRAIRKTLEALLVIAVTASIFALALTVCLFAAKGLFILVNLIV